MEELTRTNPAMVADMPKPTLAAKLEKRRLAQWWIATRNKPAALARAAS